jgi:Fic family protein
MDMKPDKFSEASAVKLQLQTSGYYAAIPKPIPPTIPATWELFGALSDADRALSELAGVARTLPNPHLLIRPFVRKEAVLSSKIEGTQASLSDLLFFEASDETDERTTDVKEVANYIRALDNGLAALEHLPIGLRFIRDLHAVLMSDPTKTPGEFRRSQNWIGKPGCSLAEATYVPPPPEALLEQLGQFETFLHRDSQLPPLLKYAVAHYQFEAIHPFLDGNGRIGRLLITLLLCADPCLEYPLLPQPLLYLSAFFERNRDEYYSRLESVSRLGDWIGWLTFFLKGITEQSRDAVQRSDNLFRLRQQHRDRIQIGRGSVLVQRIDDHLFSHPVITVPEMAKLIGCSFPGAKNAINKLVELDILSLEPPSGSRSRLYVAWDIVQTVER